MAKGIKIGDEVAVPATVRRRVTEDRVSVSIPSYGFPHSIVDKTSTVKGQHIEWPTKRSYGRFRSDVALEPIGLPPEGDGGRPIGLGAATFLRNRPLQQTMHEGREEFQTVKAFATAGAALLRAASKPSGTLGIVRSWNPSQPGERPDARVFC
ncbi:hypothetical protein EN786_25360 [Mesorhizobium sp. M4B.F.Ca.ET.143.01.1.1]|nr:hypothetical protein EOA31_05080 [Mesorhizobium sp. M4B.F.Ca.ET.049.02.1.2]TGV23221.1 hypothetical protein EN786_25360 [Mesorhizobium sp. M4B.F.Ca.ET.143.01.1.1]